MKSTIRVSNIVSILILLSVFFNQQQLFAEQSSIRYILLNIMQGHEKEVLYCPILNDGSFGKDFDALMSGYGITSFQPIGVGTKIEGSLKNETTLQNLSVYINIHEGWLRHYSLAPDSLIHEIVHPRIKKLDIHLKKIKLSEKQWYQFTDNGFLLRLKLVKNIKDLCNKTTLDP